MVVLEVVREVDQRLLDYLNEGRVTPAYARKRLIEDLDEYSRGYVQQRLARLEEHSHAENLLDSGMYELVDDPRDDVSEPTKRVEALMDAFEEIEDAFERGDPDAARRALEQAQESVSDSDPDD